MSKSVMISETLFAQILIYFDKPSETLKQAITDGLAAKITSMVDHDLYTTYKTAHSEQEREEARRKYLDAKGIPQAFRW